MARNEQLIRQHKILQILERVRFGKTLDELKTDIVDELGLKSLHTRTLRRDLDALQAAGIDVDVHENQRGKVWKLGPRAKTATKISFSTTELIALALGRELMLPLNGTQFGMGIESFWTKVKEQVPEAVLTHYEKYRRTFRVQGLTVKSYEKKQGIIRTINRGIQEHRILEVTYRSEGKPAKTRKIEPLEVVLFQSSLYTVAAANEIEDENSRIRVWKLDRFDKATLLDEWFKPPEDFEPEAFFGNSQSIFRAQESPATYKIWLAPKAVIWVTEDPWHPEQVLKENKDGSATLTVVAAHPKDVLPKVLEFGEHAELLSPAKRRKELAKEIATMAKRYK